MARRAPLAGPARARRAVLPAAALLAAFLPAALVPAAAAAQAMRVADLGPMTSRVDCLETAARVLDAYIAEHGGHASSGNPKNPEEWAYYGWGLRPGMNDVAIICPTVASRVNAYLTVHATGDAPARDAGTVTERLRALWDGLR